MGKIRWYKRDPDAALSGMFELTLEERGAFNTVLDLIYARANNLPDDDRFIAGWMKVDVRVWRRIKTRLIGLGKLRVEGGLICNERADVEVLEALSRVLSAEEAGRASGSSRRRKSGDVTSKSNGLNGTPVATESQRTLELTTTTTTEEELSSNDDSPSDDEPSLRPEHVFEGYKTLAAAIGRPVPRDFTPERRQLVRGRITQYGLEDFQTIFAKCRDSPFLRGDRDSGRTPLTFDWLMKKANFQKVLEGNYDS